MVRFVSMGDKKLEIIAKTIIDLGKAMFITGLASKFFNTLVSSPVVGFFIWISSIIVIIIGIIIHPNGGKT